MRTNVVTEVPDELLAGRYRLGSLLGRGAHGEVWEATDALTGSLCAVKRFDAESADPARIRREISALRLLHIPGVVRMLDEGLADGRPFLVMERVVGSPFPGKALPQTWPAVEPVAVALLETLARVHAAGVVHRDLKPANILVDASLRPTVLDFGVAAGAALGSGLTVDGRILGTPAYLAPEQIRNEPADARTDLYSVGILLFEALTGQLPHQADSWQGLLRSRLVLRPPALGTIAPEVPPGVAATIDALLEVAPKDRPASAADVLIRLEGRRPAAASERVLPLLGKDEPIRRALAALSAGRSCDVLGPRRSGRTRILEEIVARLAAAGREVVRLVAGRRAFSSLSPICGPLDGHASASLSDVTAEVERALAAAQARGALIVADDAERLDRWSGAVVADARARGGVLRSFVSSAPEPPAPAEDAIVLERLSADDLAPLFSQPDRVFHLRSDAAWALWRRTSGLAGEVLAEVLAWVRAGIGRWDGDRLSVDRDGLDRLDVGLGVELRAPSDPTPLEDPHLADLCAFIALSAPHSDARLLADATGHPLFRVEEALFELSSSGVVRLSPDGKVELLRRSAGTFTEEKRRKAHRTLARLLPVGAEGRLLHLIAGEQEPSAIAREALTLAEREAVRGKIGRAITVLSEGLVAARRQTARGSSFREEEEVLALWLDVALEESTAPALDRLLYEVSRCHAKSPALAGIEGTARAALSALTGHGDRAQAWMDAVPPFEAPMLERRRRWASVLAARRAPLEVEAEVVEQAVRWARTSGDARAHAAAFGWLGRLRYRQDRFEEAAREHIRAASLEPWLIARIAAQLNAASALMEAGRLDEARELAQEARRAAEEHRQARYEARAEWLLRSIAYRNDEAGAPDTELCDLADQTGVPEMAAFICLNEAAVAYRSGDMPLAASLAGRAELVWETLGKPWTAALAAALRTASGGGAPDPVAALLERGLSCPSPAIGVQIVALASRAWPAQRTNSMVARAEEMAERVPRSAWGARMEVLSLEEALRILKHGFES